MEDKQFWIQLGQDFGETKQLSQDTSNKLEKFITNDFKHLDKKVDKLSAKVAWIVGGISALAVAINILVRILG